VCVGVCVCTVCSVCSPVCTRSWAHSPLEDTCWSDHTMPIMDRLYGFKDFKTVMGAPVAHNCVNEGNAGAVTISSTVNGYPVSGIRTATSLCPLGAPVEPSRPLLRLLDHSIRQTHTVGLLCTRDQLVSEAGTYTTEEQPCPLLDSNPRLQQSATLTQHN
jgi:hypothetical protein